ncbi:MAG TPA: FxLYD domain-containing protein [Candidatus Moranbacteria bacterium]|nr:FxLYD domain-containing protein [Candidatus Moranbacteria bacterium]HRZ33646.1 FxLYD domain-containing protein [Candidatus Moranbacteria bacterium]
MENSEIIKKRIKIIAGYLVVFVVIVFISYLLFSPAATCSDKIQNQGEKGIDCGGPCSPCKDVAQIEDLIIDEVAFAYGGNDVYDVVAKIYNPNESMGAKSFRYIFTLKDKSGLTIKTQEGYSFILPSDTRYLAVLNLKTENDEIPKDVSVEISDTQWEKLSKIGKPQIGVYSKKFGAAPTPNSSQVEGLIRNESGYDFKKIDATIVIRDENGNIIGINTTQRDSVRAKEEQKFSVSWPYLLQGNIQNIEVDPQINVFDSENFSVSR